jgi:hypothetical protein
MDNIVLIDVEIVGVIETHAVIDHGDGSFTSMLKSTYDEMIAQQEAAKPLL